MVKFMIYNFNNLRLLNTTLVKVTLTFIFCGLIFADVYAQGGDENLTPRMVAYKYLQQNQPAQAEFAFLKAIQIAPKDVTNFRDIALLYLTEKNYVKAINWAKSGLKLKPTDEDLRMILANAYIKKGDNKAAISELKSAIHRNPKNVFAYYNLSKLNVDPAHITQERTYLIKTLSIVPANIIPRLQLVENLARAGKADSCLYYLQGVKKIEPRLSSTLLLPYNQAITSLQSNQTARALIYIRKFNDMMKITSLYARDLAAVEGPRLPVGYSEFTTSEYVNKYQSDKKVSLQDIRFTDATKAAGLEFKKPANSTHSVLAVTDFDNMGEMYLYASDAIGNSSSSECRLMKNETGSFQPVRVMGGISHDGRDMDAAFADYDNDGYQDLFVATNKGIILYKNQGDGTFAEQNAEIGLRSSANGNKMLFADFDQDGDLDLFLACSNGNKFYRNNGNGTFTEQAAVMGLSGGAGSPVGADYDDYDVDGDMDIITVNETNGITLFDNQRHARFKKLTAATKLQYPRRSGMAITLGDYNNDGLPDIFVAGRNGKCSLLRNINGTHFVEDKSSKQFSLWLKNINVEDVAFFDFDNDGHLDLLVAGEGGSSSSGGVKLFHNNGLGRFTDESDMLPRSVTQARRIGIADFNADGDDDIFLSGPDGVKLIRNDGGNLNHYMQVHLNGFTYGNNRNNRLGIGAQVELKAGDLFQLKTVKRAVVNFGVGNRSKLDAVRIIWPNGMPQVINDPSRNERIVEQEMLKGSCPFLFAWNGKKYEFIKDMMWRSALGMPLAINGADTTYAFSDASTEYLLIPGEKLKPDNGRYKIKITEELWEAIYFDKLNLVAVDHPDSVSTYVDERFVPPPFPGKKVYPVTTKYLPVSAQDGKGNNLLDKLNAYDFNYVSNFSLGKFQGLAEDHDLILDLGSRAKADSIMLFLRGWIYPTDASINTALAQSPDFKLSPPCLQVIDKNGEWKTVIASLGFPMGRDKMVIANLSGKFLTDNDRRVRIRTNMQIYWDHIFFTTGTVKAPVDMHDVTMLTATLGHHGYSTTYRKGGPYGPEWLDYYNITQGQKWRDLTGYYTRYGDVMPLLQKGDDKYVICSSGDEMTVEFDAEQLPVLPKGWKRDFLIYSEGWVKDGDLNTACGQTVEPLPYHAMPSYPYGANSSYPNDAEHIKYRREYNTRKITTDRFKNALKVSK
jgi:Tfp pilus assembly protein PilF